MKQICSNLIVAITLLVFLPYPASSATLQVAERYPVAGEPITVTLTGDAVETGGDLILVAEYRPNSASVFSQEVPRDNSVPNRWRFTPSIPGLVLLKAMSRPASGNPGVVTATLALSVKFARPPVLGIAIMLIAGTILFGGTAVALIRGMMMKGSETAVTM